MNATKHDFGIGSILVLDSTGSIDQSCLSQLWMHAGKQSVVRADEAESNGQNAIMEPCAVGRLYQINNVLVNWLIITTIHLYYTVNNDKRGKQEV